MSSHQQKIDDHIAEAWRSIDCADSGTVSAAELRTAFDPILLPTRLEEVMRLADHDHSGVIGFPEFHTAYGSLLLQRACQGLSDARFVWASFENRTKDGRETTVQDVHRGLHRLGLDVGIEAVLALAGETTADLAVTGESSIVYSRYCVNPNPNRTVNPNPNRYVEAHHSDDPVWAEIRAGVMARHRLEEEFRKGHETGGTEPMSVYSNTPLFASCLLPY
jgi:hypothetical protein